MSTKRKNRISPVQGFLLASLGAFALGLAGCSGDNGPKDTSTPPNPVFPPGPGTGAAVPITSAKTIVASITRVTMQDDGKAVVELYLRDENNFSLKGLPAANISFVLARLEPAANGASSTWHAITRRTDAFPGTPAPTPADKVTGTGPTNQGYTEAATAGVWTDKQNGVYTYTFARSVKNDAEIPYDGSLPHRVGLEIRLTPAIPSNNAVYTFTPATNLPVNESGREVVDNDTCNACHDNLSWHGGARFDLQYCAMCHESYSFDAQSGNTIDLKVMIHKIHAGETLPSVEAGGFYGIFGFRNTFTDFSDVVYPQDKRNCTTCHEESDTDTPQASNWRYTVNRATCSACHDNVNFATGENHGGRRGDRRHLHGVPRPELPGGQPARVECARDPRERGGQALQVRSREGAGHQARRLAGRHRLRSHGRSLQGPARRVPAGDDQGQRPDDGHALQDHGSGVHQRYPVHAGATGHDLHRDGRAAARARRLHDDEFHEPGERQHPRATDTGRLPCHGGRAIRRTRCGGRRAHAECRRLVQQGWREAAAVRPHRRLGRVVPRRPHDRERQRHFDAAICRGRRDVSAGVVFPITDAAPVPRRAIVDVQRCNDCHQKLSFHGDNRNNNTELCATCHNPENAAGATLAAGRPWDFKLLIHGIHSAQYDFGGLNFASVRYPGKINNCEGCHKPDTYYPVDPVKVFATSITRGADAASPVDDIAYTPNAAICSSCHTTAQAKLHIEQNGGSFNATKNADGTSSQAAAETCAACHGPGKPADVKVSHGVGQFQYNN